jgi:hypothetical protein
MHETLKLLWVPFLLHILAPVCTSAASINAFTCCTMLPAVGCCSYAHHALALANSSMLLQMTRHAPQAAPATAAAAAAAALGRWSVCRLCPLAMCVPLLAWRRPS